MSRTVYVQREPAGLWANQAACRGNYETHFPTAPSQTPEHRAQVAAAKQICSQCPVQEECLDLAIRNREREGVWGGYEFPNGLRSYRRKQQRLAAG